MSPANTPRIEPIMPTPTPTLQSQYAVLVDFFARELITLVCERTDVPFGDTDAVYAKCGETLMHTAGIEESILRRLRHHLAIEL